MSKGVKRLVGIGVVSGVAYAAWRAWSARVPPQPNGIEWSNAPFPFPPEQAAQWVAGGPVAPSSSSSQPASARPSARSMGNPFIRRPR